VRPLEQRTTLFLGASREVEQRMREELVAAQAAQRQVVQQEVATRPGLPDALEGQPIAVEADPTLRVAAKGSGENEGLLVECVYDAIQRTKSCKLS
jgi:hypothetical protein